MTATNNNIGHDPLPASAGSHPADRTGRPDSPKQAARVKGSTARRSPRNLAICTALPLVLLAWLCLLQWRTLRSARHTGQVQSAALVRMKLDAERIAELQAAPRRATDRLKANDELLAEIDAALKAAEVPGAHWQDSIPQPPQRHADSSYTRRTTRLYFEEVALRQLLAFAHALLDADPALFISSVRVSADRAAERADEPANESTWHVELSVSYLVYAPKTG